MFAGDDGQNEDAVAQMPQSPLQFAPGSRSGEVVMANDVSEPAQNEIPQSIAIARLIIGALQGLALYALYSAADAHVFPATNTYLFVPLSLIVFFVPLILLQGLTVMRLRTLAVWASAAAILLALLGLHDVYREWPQPPAMTKGLQDTNLPSFALFFFVSVAIFIGHALIAGGDAARKWIAPYPLYFEAAWKLGLQFALSVVFTGLFWLVLWLGAALFNLIGIDALERIIEKAWFAIPATALALSVAVHVSDMRAGMVASIRSMVLALLSWLLPLMALFAGAFLLALFVTGLDPLWKTRAAAAILLTASGALVFFANCAYQDGTKNFHKALWIASGVAALALLPFVGIAAYAIGLRVAQYGWTADRVAAVAVTVVALCYACGYLFAGVTGLLKRSWGHIVETTNVAASFLVVAVILILFSPIADPARVAVASQVSALEEGRIAPEKFDFYHLRWHGERYGHDALTALARSKNKTIARRADEALKGYFPSWSPPRPTNVAAQIKVYPGDHKLPAALLERKWDIRDAPELPSCFVNAQVKCEAFVIDLNGDGKDEYLFTWGAADDGWEATVMAEDEKGGWYPAATLPWPHCKAAREAFRKGQYAVVAPKGGWRGIDAGETNFQPVPVMPIGQGCPGTVTTRAVVATPPKPD